MRFLLLLVIMISASVSVAVAILPANMAQLVKSKGLNVAAATSRLKGLAKSQSFGGSASNGVVGKLTKVAGKGAVTTVAGMAIDTTLPGAGLVFRAAMSHPNAAKKVGGLVGNRLLDVSPLGKVVKHRF